MGENGTCKGFATDLHGTCIGLLKEFVLRNKETDFLKRKRIYLFYLIFDAHAFNACYCACFR